MQKTKNPNQEIYTLQNGLRVVLENRPGRTVTSSTITVKSGSRYENDMEQGFSHFIEHMLFKGTAKYSSKKISSEVEKYGGILNASTGHETTQFYIRMPSISQSTAFKYLAEIFLRPAFPSRELEKERNVVIEEIHQIEDNPYQKMYEVAFKQLYGKHPLGRPIIGSEERIASCTRDELLKYYRSKYTAIDSVLSIAGGLWKTDKEKLSVMKEIEKHFSAGYEDCGDGPTVTKANIKKGLVYQHKKGLAQTYFLVALDGYKKDLYKGFEIDAYGKIMGEGMSSRLFQKVREKLGLCYSISSFNYTMEKEGLFGVVGSSKADYQKAVDVTIAELKKSLSEPFTDKEIDDAKTSLLGSHYIELDGVHYTAEENGRSLLHGELREPEKTINAIKSITKKSTQDFMQNLWKDFRPSVISLT